ncbi:MAG: hypothetical protein BRC32_01390 [Actinobacteria bacterium QS_8_72_14]|nr:MAG: hypothetical protein BRC32_01390 [Actinobacteria bacterium QS_8_72_14]
MAEVQYRLHALRQMVERGISVSQVQQVLTHGEVVEEARRAGRPYPTRLLLGWIHDRPLHVLVAAAPEGSQYVITAYKPSLDRWEGDYRTRKERP